MRWATVRRLGAAVALTTLLTTVASAAEQPGPGDVELVVPATVRKIRDGDTLQVQLDSGRVDVRLYGIDTPEPGTPFNREAKRALKSLLRGQDIELLPVSQDRYDRMVAVIYADGASVNEALLAQGHGWAYRDFLGQVPGDERYCELEADARTGSRGLWAQPPARWLPPWIHRAQQREQSGMTVVARDYSNETAADCLEAVRVAREGKRKASGRTAPPPPVVTKAPKPAEPTSDHPPGCDIKGNISRSGRIYHVPGSPHYDATQIDVKRGERWFCSEEAARAAGWRAPK